MTMKQLKYALALCRKAMREAERRNCNRQGFPDHAHDIPETWNNDGKPCAICRRWNKAMGRREFPEPAKAGE